jgi:S-adenosyl-L-methionine hydrolase (adenosine-forming)
LAEAKSAEVRIVVSNRVITLLTDFGAEDYFVGAMKGVILTRSPGSILVDITHDIPAHDIQAAAFTLNGAYAWFPAGSIHLAVVDPGVGSARRPILVHSGDHLFVGPDNGLFTLVLDQFPAAQTRHITNSAYFLPEPSTTFHGRDVFAPVAAALAEGILPEALGPIIHDTVRLGSAVCAPLPDGSLNGKIVHIDHFGNCVTNLPSHLFPKTAETRPFVLQGNGFEAWALARSYEEGALCAARPFLIRGSAGLLEIALSCSSAAKAFGISVADPVRLIWRKSK